MAFSAIEGQERAITLLSRALANSRLAHAYLFAGPDGVGKTTVALDLAALLFCRRPEQGRPCGACSGCRQFASGNHPDFFRIRPEGAAIKIDQIRGIKKSLYFPPLEGDLRVFLLEEAQTMRREAGNSLLKVLEEPPPGNLFLLTGNTAGVLLPTIVSRCQVIPFTALPQAMAAGIIRKQRPEISEAQALALAALSDGCPGQALALEADDIVLFYQQLTEALLADTQKNAARVEKALSLAAGLPESEEGMGHLLHLLRVFFKDAMAAGDCPPEMRRARERWNFQELSAKMQAIGLTEEALARNCNRPLSGEVLLLHLFDCFSLQKPDST